MRETTAIAARLSGVAARTIQRWASEGRITSRSRSGKIYVSPTEVQRLAEHRHAGQLPCWTGRSIMAHADRILASPVR